jgi:predicted RNA-binding Zn-ribbon protein involved in translation (DUF1610 family)
MSLYFVCRKCGTQGELPDELRAHEHRCPQCGEVGIACANAATSANSMQVAENAVMASVGNVTQRTDTFKATMSFAGLCLMVLCVVAYFGADPSINREPAGPFRVPNLVWQGIASVVGATAYVLIVVDGVRSQYPFWRS